MSLLSSASLGCQFGRAVAVVVRVQGYARCYQLIDAIQEQLAMELPSEPDLRLDIYTAAPDTPTADALKLLASWAATRTVGWSAEQRGEQIRARRADAR